MNDNRPNPKQLILSVCSYFSFQSGLPTRDEVNLRMNQLASSGAFGEISMDDLENCLKQILGTISVVVAPAKVLTDKKYQPWLLSKKSSINSYYWNRYQTLLLQKGIPKAVVVELESSVENVLDKTFDPSVLSGVDRRGLVMGNVQSGKTQHYIALMTKAADAGFTTIIVIAGLHNSLRNQTQERVDEGFIGMRWNGQRGSSRLPFGVGRNKNESNRRNPSAFTASVRDFNIETARSLNLPLINLNEPAVFVIKKNKNTLETLLTWLESNKDATGQIPQPLLLIDDEADNASINTAGEGGDPSVINSLIRRVLDTFSKSAYVAYTATPFANIFIDPETEDEMFSADLFPQSFIIGLEPPSNYVGPARIFGGLDSNFLCDIDDYEQILPLNHKSTHRIAALPASLRDAMCTFLLARAIRVLRGQGYEHSAMMINASRFISVQNQLHTEIHLLLNDYRNAIQTYGALDSDDALQNDLIKEIFASYVEHYKDVGYDWPTVLASLWDAVAPIEVIEVNMKSASTLDYKNYDSGRHLIAVGGLSLSRGLTLEGLTVSYYLRNTQMYDTLLQMGRWFGYRPGYEDLVRIWMPESSQDWYRHVTDVIEEVRCELSEMQSQNMSPVEFGLKVRRHPGTLMITARNKQGKQHTVSLNMSFNLRQIETYQMSTRAYKHNRTALTHFESKINETDLEIRDLRPVEKSWLEIRNVPVSIVLSFLEEYDEDNNLAGSPSQSDLLVQYIKQHRAHLEQWDVAIPSIRFKSEGNEFKIFGQSITCQERTVSNIRVLENGFRFDLSNRRRLSSPGIDRAGMRDHEIELAEKEWRSSDKGNEGKSIPDIAYRSHRKNPLLALHLVKPNLDKARKNLNVDVLDVENEKLFNELFVGWGVSIPDLKENDVAIPVRYSVTETWLRNHAGPLDEGEDDDVEY